MVVTAMETLANMKPHKNAAAASWVSIVCLVSFAIAFVIYTGLYLPETVATHFGVDNQPNGGMTRSGYLIFMVSFMVGVPTIVSLAVGTLPRQFPDWTNVPNRAYWLAPERRADSLRFLSAHGKRLGSLVLMLMLGMHYTVLIANHRNPPMLPVATFSSVILGFALALVWWIVRLYRRFGKVPH
jgi:serine/threonine-protein kinase